jgi:hypothetical protein
MAKSWSLNPLDHGRFVVLRHDGISDPHFDLMFERAEMDAALVTFRCPSWPITSRTTLLKLPDHRIGYLTYEGPVSDNRGFVRQVEAGRYESWKVGENSYQLALPDGRHFRLKHVSEAEWQVEPVQSIGA